MRGEQKESTRSLLNRGNLRDVVITLSLASTLISPLPTVNKWLPLLVLTLGCLIHLVVKGQLIRNRVLCTRGTYSIVRNPYYLANYLIDSSMCLLSANIYLVLLYPFLFFWAYQPTLRSEEVLLSSMHSSQFLAYRSAVPQLFPESLSERNFRKIITGFSRTNITSNEVKRIIRFWCAVIFILVVRDVRIEGLHELIFWKSPFDFDGLGVLALFVVGFVVDRVTSKRGKHVAA